MKTGQTHLLSSDAGANEPTWVGLENLALWLKGGEKGTTELYLANVDRLELKYVQILINKTYIKHILTLIGLN